MTAWQLGDKVSIPELIDLRAQLSGPKTALTVGGEAVTFDGLARGSIAYGNGLATIGAAKGDAVVLLMDNSVAGVLGWLGCSRIGAVDIPINTAYTGDFLQRTLQNAGATIALSDEKYLDSLLPVARDGGITTIVVHGGGAPALERVRHAGLHPVPWSALADNDDAALTRAARVGYLDGSSVIYTSGTTGASKGVTFSHNYLLSASQQMATLFGVGEDDVYYGSMPLFHLAAKGCGIVVPLIYGSSAVLDAKFSVSRTWQRVRETNATLVHLLGSMMVMLYNRPPEPDDATLPVRAVFGAPIPGTVQRQFEERFGCRISTCYALSEACPITRAGVDLDYPLNSAGHTNDELFDVRLVDEFDEDVAPNTVGEVIVRPKQPGVMFDGYWRNPQATLEVFTHLWFHTGDLGRIDEDGWFYFEGRKKDSLRRRGENVSVAELEDAVRQHPGINDVAAVGVPSEVMEDDIMVYVEPDSGVALTPEQVYEFCREHLPFFMVPRYIEIVTELPRNPVAKIEKFKLRAAGLGARTWDSTRRHDTPVG